MRSKLGRWSVCFKGAIASLQLAQCCSWLLWYVFLMIQIMWTSLLEADFVCLPPALVPKRLVVLGFVGFLGSPRRILGILGQSLEVPVKSKLKYRGHFANSLLPPVGLTPATYHILDS